MDPQDVIAMAVKLVLKRQRPEKRLMEESLEADKVALQMKGRERSMRKRINQGMRAKEAAKKKFVDEHMVFFGAPTSNDLENAQKFDEKAMMNNISNMMNSDCRENGGFPDGYGESHIPGIELGLVEKAMMDAIEPQLKSIATCGGDNGGFAVSHGDSNVPGIDLALVEKATLDAIEAQVNSVATCGGDNGGFASGHGGISSAAENANNMGKEGLMTPTEGTRSDGGEGSNGCH
ncbi:hypothetical protein DITRI_Ditri20bG0051300 [Diplodiscus trichospermus]